MPSAASLLSWAALLALGGLGLYAGRGLFADAYRDAVFRLDPLAAQLPGDWPVEKGRSADYFEMAAEAALAAPLPDFWRVSGAARQAVSIDGDRAFAWAMLAYAERMRQGKLSADSIAALARSMAACPLCEESLIRWRFNFVLANWDDTPETLRRQAFEHADVLRWSGENAEFLAEMRIKAEAANLPYAAYRVAVDSPAPMLDKGISLDLPDLLARPEP